MEGQSTDDSGASATIDISAGAATGRENADALLRGEQALADANASPTWAAGSWM